VTLSDNEAIRKLIQTLEHYADPENWTTRKNEEKSDSWGCVWDEVKPEDSDLVKKDRGSYARHILKKYFGITEF
jgi:hypothetical protein